MTIPVRAAPLGTTATPDAPADEGRNSPGLVQPAPDERLVLAYDAALKSLQRQTDTVNLYRTRVASQLTLSGLVTSFAAGVGLISTDPTKGAVLPTWCALALVAIFLAGVLAAYFMFRPVKAWAFGADPAAILAHVDRGTPLDEARRDIVEKLIAGRTANNKALQKVGRFYFVIYALLPLEIAVFVAGIVATRL